MEKSIHKGKLFIFAVIVSSIIFLVLPSAASCKFQMTKFQINFKYQISIPITSCKKNARLITIKKNTCILTANILS